jgi:hypothetical protein
MLASIAAQPPAGGLISGRTLPGKMRQVKRRTLRLRAPLDPRLASHHSSTT